MRLRLTQLSRTALAGVGVIAGVALVAAHLSSGAASAAATDVMAVGPGEGGGPHVRTFGPDGKDGGVNFYAQGTGVSGTNIAVGDVTGDGIPEIITGTGPGIEAEIQVWSRDGKTLLGSVKPFPGFTGGVNVALTNADENPALEIIAGAGPGGGPHVKVFHLGTNFLNELFAFYAYDVTFHGGVFVAGANGRIITGAGAGGGPHVRVWSLFGGQPQVTAEWFAFPNFAGGVHVAAGAVRTDAIDVVTAPGSGTPGKVQLWSLSGAEGPSFMPYGEGFQGGVWVGVANGKRLITGAGPGGAPHVKMYTFANEAFSQKLSFYAFAPEFTGGVRVAGFPALPPVVTTTTTAAGCSGLPLPAPIGCVGGASTPSTTAKPATTTTTVKPTTTTIGDGGPTTSTTLDGAGPSPSTTSTTAKQSAGFLGLPIPIP